MYVKQVLSFFLILFLLPEAQSQQPQKSCDEGAIDTTKLIFLRHEYGNKKTYPSIFEKQVLVALSYYPELKNTRITFRTRPRHGTAITRSAWGSVILPAGSREYVITISDSVEPVLEPLLLKNLSFNAQVGVIGHELAHVVQYDEMTTAGLLTYAVRNLSASYIDRFEFSADAICIAHGLGYQLLEWSTYVRQKMKTVHWRGPDFVHRKHTKERYMNPSTIINRIHSDSMYSTLDK